MKLKQVLFTGVLTTLAAIMLLTVVLQQPAEAGRARNYTITCQNAYSWVQGAGTISQARSYCGATNLVPECDKVVSVETMSSNPRNICR